MRIEEVYRCIQCGGTLTSDCEGLKCKVCETRYPLIEDIPIFGAVYDITKWTDYYTKHYSDTYISDAPSPPATHYTRFLPTIPAKVLDAGGGDGNATADWAQSHPASEVHVMDLSLHALRKVLRRNLPNMFPVCTSACARFPFADNYFDAIITVFMVEHLAPISLNRFLQESYRVLKPRGSLVVASDTAFYDKWIHPFERIIRTGRYIPSNPTHINLMHPRKCEALIKQHGFILQGHDIYLIAGRHKLARVIYKLMPKAIVERYCSTMFVISAIKH